MRRPPRAPDAPLFSPALITWSLTQGATVLLLVGAIYLMALRRGLAVPEVRALTFFSLVTAIVSLILVNRSFSTSLVAAFTRRNVALRWVLVTVVSMLALTVLWPAARALFRFGPLHAGDLVVTVGGGLLVLLALEAAKPLWRGRLRI